jgi:Na+(H+)/acetate symporter ActP
LLLWRLNKLCAFICIILEIAKLNSKTSNNNARLVASALIVNIAKLVAITFALSVARLAATAFAVAITAALLNLVYTSAYKGSKSSAASSIT